MKTLDWNKLTVAILLAVIVYSLVPALRAEDCSKLNWVKQDARTQGGGWIWFPGKATARDLETASLYALGRSLDYLQGECGIVPKAVKFNEKCVEHHRNGSVTVYVRASIKGKVCRYAANANNVIKQKMANLFLTKQLNNYRDLTTSTKISYECDAGDIGACLDKLNSYYAVYNLDMTLKYAKRACKLGHDGSCGTAGVLYKNKGMWRTAYQWADKGCPAGSVPEGKPKKYATAYACKVKKALAYFMAKMHKQGVAY